MQAQIEMNANIQFYDGMTTGEIQEVLIRSANDLISLDAPIIAICGWARLLSYGIYKEVFGGFEQKYFKEMIELNIERGVYDGILDFYTDDEIAKLDSYMAQA